MCSKGYDYGQFLELVDPSPVQYTKYNKISFNRISVLVYFELQTRLLGKEWLTLRTQNNKVIFIRQNMHMNYICMIYKIHKTNYEYELYRHYWIHILNHYFKLENKSVLHLVTPGTACTSKASMRSFRLPFYFDASIFFNILFLPMHLISFARAESNCEEGKRTNLKLENACPHCDSNTQPWDS